MTKGVVALAWMLSFAALAAAQEKTKVSFKDARSCNEFAAPARQALGKSIGVEQCYIVAEETVFNIKGQRFRRVEVRLSGTVDGWASREKGSRAAYFTDGPEFVLVQSGLTGPRSRAVGRYEGATKHGMTILYPESAKDWNGKLYITAHGAGSYGAVGNLVERDPRAKFNPHQNINRYVTLMIDRGYAVAHTMRSSDRIRGDVEVSLEDGTALKGFNLSSHAGLLRSWTELARNMIGQRVGARPKRIYFYGHSAGGFWGRQMNYQPGANVDSEGMPLFDAFLLDDAGSGLWLPKLVVDGKDTLFMTDEGRRSFAKQIDTTHQLYLGESGDFLVNKRENAKMLRDKGLGAKHRVYEFRGVSHFDSGQVSRVDLMDQTVDLTGLYDALIEKLDIWAEKDIAPPPSKADLLELGDADKDGVNEHPAIALPNVACPQGVYYTFPPEVDPGRRGGQETALAYFDGVNLEPLDGRGELVDMNGNGKRDQRETLTQAWQRLGLLKAGQKLTQGAYVSCVKNAALKLVKDGLLLKRAAEHYIEQAQRTRVANGGAMN